MIERCDGGQYMYLPSWRVIYTSRIVTIAVWGEGGRGGESRFLLPLFSLLAFLLSRHRTIS